jgi:hypothetical protein
MEGTVSKGTVQEIMSLLQEGVKPLFRLRVRKGRDSVLIRVTDTDNKRFYCVTTDSVKEHKMIVSHDSIKYGTFILEELIETKS